MFNLSEFARGNYFLNSLSARMPAIPASFDKYFSGLVRNSNSFTDFFGVHTQRFFTQYVLARFHGLNRPRQMKSIWERDIDRLNAIVGEKIVIRGVDPAVGRKYFCFLGVT